MKKNLGSKGFRFKWNEGVFFLQNLIKFLSALHEVYMSRILVNVIGSFAIGALATSTSALTNSV